MNITRPLRITALVAAIGLVAVVAPTGATASADVTAAQVEGTSSLPTPDGWMPQHVPAFLTAPLQVTQTDVPQRVRA
ncbi:hypothetical protein [Demequina sp. NBRC 110051]|uniref:hypothetical protein n=1 Tax=Demequina sp. NBRC 110051 TaxID=1570340 RepID=UPI000A077808|nr:hypothetical protein [Demequina sp. NBRC 110051]